MNVDTHEPDRPSRYALAVLERGDAVLTSQIARLEEIIRTARSAMRPGDPARTPLDMVSDLETCDCRQASARRLDRLSSAVVNAQRLVSHESRASAILFLDASKRDKWTCYGDYRRSWSDYVAAVVARH